MAIEDHVHPLTSRLLYLQIPAHAAGSGSAFRFGPRFIPHLTARVWILCTHLAPLAPKRTGVSNVVACHPKHWPESFRCRYEKQRRFI